jgi:DNA-binding XRE family transcriptional regulator
MELQNSENTRRGDSPLGRPGTAPVPVPSPAPIPRTRPATAHTPAERGLGLALYQLRLENGLSLRALAQRLGYNAHSVVADIEKGRKIPSESLVRSYEECFGLPAGSLRTLRQQAMAERAQRMTAKLASTVPPPVPPVPPADSGPDPDPGPDPVGEESIPDVVGRLIAAVLNETRKALDRWAR